MQRADQPTKVLVCYTLVAGLVVFLSIIGLFQLKHAVFLFTNKSKDLMDTTAQVVGYTDKLQAQVIAYNATFEECAGPDSAPSSLWHFEGRLDTIRELVLLFEDRIDSVQQSLRQDTLPAFEMLTWVVIGLVWLIFALGVAAVKTECEQDDIILYIATSMALFASTYYIGYQLYTSVSISNFCAANPDDAILKAAEMVGNMPPSAVRTIAYYTSCAGDNPLESRKSRETISSKSHSLRAY